MNRFNVTPHALVRLAVALCIVTITACGPPPPPEPEEALPPPPTPSEIANSIAQQAQITGPLPPKGAVMPPSVRQQVVGIFRSAKMTHAGTPDGDRVLAILSNKLSARIGEAESRELNEHTIAYIDSYDVLNPESNRFALMHANVTDILQRPKVDLIGILETDGRRYAYLELKEPLTGAIYKENLAIGEQTRGVRLLDWFGENRGVQMEYVDSGERFTVLMDMAE